MQIYFLFIIILNSYTKAPVQIYNFFFEYANFSVIYNRYKLEFFLASIENMPYLCWRQTAILPNLKIYIMTFYESASKHEAFNEVLSLFNKQPELTRNELFYEILNMAIKQGETGQELIKAEKNEN